MTNKMLTNVIGGGKSLQSQTIDFLRFPMAILVVMLHSSFINETRNGKSIFANFDSPCYTFIDTLFVNNITTLAVPTFFIISGYLFFIKNEQFGISEYWEKIKKRFRSLFVPYVLWNILILLLYVVVQHVAPNMVSGRNKAIADYSLSDYFICFFNTNIVNGGIGPNQPIDGPLWFIRDLIAMAVLSPIIYYAFKLLKYWLLLILLAFYYCVHVSLMCPTNSSIFFFSLGAFFGIYKVNIVELVKPFGRYLILAYIILLASLFVVIDSSLNSLLASTARIIGCFAAIYLASWLLEKEFVRNNKFLAGSSFFIFAAHCELLKVMVRLVSRLGIQYDMFYVVAYFLCPALTVAILLAVCWVLRKYTPMIATTLCGGR